MPAPPHPTGLLIIVSGATAAGKTTVAREVASRRARAIHLDGDTIQNAIRSGAVGMDIPAPPGAIEQLRLRYAAILAVANLYRDAGFDAVLSDNLFAEEADRFLRSALEAHPSRDVHFVMLQPSNETIRERYRRRPGGGYTETLTPAVLEEAVARTARVGLWLDTSRQTVAESAQEILDRLSEARLPVG